LVTGTVAEELMIGRGLGKILDERKVDAVITCEPTGVNQLAVAGVGRTTVEMTVRGLVAHSAQTHLGDNAVYRAMDACERIRKMPRREDPLFDKDVIELVEIKSSHLPATDVFRTTAGCLGPFVPGRPRRPNSFHTALEDFDGGVAVKSAGSRLATTGERLDYGLPRRLSRRLVPSGLVEQASGKRIRSFLTEIAPTPRKCRCHGLSLIYGPGTLTLHKPNSIDIELLWRQAYGRMIELWPTDEVVCI
jgi:acetylornithine deacetylase/succinyl-diaminopimelate desuccinylase-like protein